MNGSALTISLSDDAIAVITKRVREEVLADVRAELAAPKPTSPWMTIVEAAEYLRCPRHRVDDLLSQRRLTRYKAAGPGNPRNRPTLVARAEVEALVAPEDAPRRRGPTITGAS